MNDLDEQDDDLNNDPPPISDILGSDNLDNDPPPITDVFGIGDQSDPDTSGRNVLLRRLGDYVGPGNPGIKPGKYPGPTKIVLITNVPSDISDSRVQYLYYVTKDLSNRYVHKFSDIGPHKTLK